MRRVERMTDEHALRRLLAGGDELRAWNAGRGGRNNNFWPCSLVNLRDELRLDIGFLGRILGQEPSQLPRSSAFGAGKYLPLG